MEAGGEKGGWESGFYFLIFTDIVKMGWDTKPNQHETKRHKKFSFTRHCKYIAVLVVVLYTMMIYPHSNELPPCQTAVVQFSTRA